MDSPYSLITINRRDLLQYKEGFKKSKIKILLDLVLGELPDELQQEMKFTIIDIREIEGFEDDKVKGYILIAPGNKVVEAFIHSYIPFFILEK